MRNRALKMEENSKPSRTPRKNPSPRKLVRVNLEPNLSQVTSVGANGSAISESAKTVATILSKSFCCETDRKQSSMLECTAVDKRLPKDQVSISRSQKNTFSCVHVVSGSSKSELLKRKRADEEGAEPLSKRSKCDPAESNSEFVRQKTSKSNIKQQVVNSCLSSETKTRTDMPKDSWTKLKKSKNLKLKGNQTKQEPQIDKSNSKKVKFSDSFADQSVSKVVVKVKSALKETDAKDRLANSANIRKRLTFDNKDAVKINVDVVSTSVPFKININESDQSSFSGESLNLSMKNMILSQSNNDSRCVNAAHTGTLFNSPVSKFQFAISDPTGDVLDLSVVDSKKNPVSCSNGPFVEAVDGYGVLGSGTQESSKNDIKNNVTEAGEASAKQTSHSRPELCNTEQGLQGMLQNNLPEFGTITSIKSNVTAGHYSPMQVNNKNVQVTPAASDGIQKLADELGVLNQQSSHIATHIYRRQTPRRKRRQLFSGMLSQNYSTSGTPYRRLFGKTPSKCSPRVTPKGPIRLTHSPFIAKQIFNSPTLQTVSPSSLKMKTPSKSTVKRKLYPETPEICSEKPYVLSSVVMPEDCYEKVVVAQPTEIDLQHSGLGSAQMEDHILSCPDEAFTPERLKIADAEEIEEQEDEENGDDGDDRGEEEEVIPDLDEHIDRLLEEKSKKIHLTARNVRNIIHQVLTDDDVKVLFHNAIEEGELKEQLQAAIFEPMLTRSKLKEVIEKGQIPPPFTMTPIRTEGSKTFLDMNFPEEEDDEEYQPSNEELERCSDDDESLHSSHASDIGSPNVSICSKKSQRFDEECNIALRTRSKLPLNDTPLTEIEASFVAPDITPDLYDTECHDDDWAEFLAGLFGDVLGNENLDDDMNDPEFNLMQEMDCAEEDPEESRNDRAVRISKKEVKELMGELFEEHDEFDPTCELFDDQDESIAYPALVEQLDAVSSVISNSQLLSGSSDDVAVEGSTDFPSSEPKTTSSDSVEQPHCEADHQEPNTLLGYPGHMPPLKLNTPLVSVLMSELIKLKNAEEKNVKDEALLNLPDHQSFSPKELIQLKDQMQKHVQLLVQSYVQSWPQDWSELVHIADFSKRSLVQLRELAEQSAVPCRLSYFYTPNLDEAIEIANTNYSSKNQAVEEIVLNLMKNKLTTKKIYEMFGLTYEQMEVFMTSRVFIFPQMLPDYRLVSFVEESNRVIFSEAEDNLLAMGIEQFGHLPNKYSLIRQYLLPTKTSSQLLSRFKNLNARGRSKRKQGGKSSVNNPISFLLQNKCLPTFPRYLEVEDEDQIVAPKDQDPDLLPKWFLVFKEIQQLHAKQLNLRPWTICGIPGSFLSEHGNRFDLRPKSATRSKFRPVLPQTQLPSNIASQLSFIDPAATMYDQAMVLTDPSVSICSQSMVLTDPELSAKLGNPSVIIADSSAGVNCPTVILSNPASNIENYLPTVINANAVFQILSTIHPASSSSSSSSSEVPLQINNLVAEVTNSGAEMTCSVEQMTNFVVPLDDPVMDMTVSSEPLSEQTRNSDVQRDDSGISSVVHHGGGLSVMFDGGFQDLSRKFDTYSAATSSATVLSSDTGLMSDAAALSLKSYSQNSSGSYFGTSYSTFSCYPDMPSYPLAYPSLMENPEASISVPITVHCESGSINLHELSSSFSRGSFDNLNLSAACLHATARTSCASANNDIQYSDAAVLTGSHIMDFVPSASSWNGQMPGNIARTTAVVISAVKTSLSAQDNPTPSIVLSPNKFIPTSPNTPEPVLILTQRQLKQLGLAVNVLSLPTISTPKVLLQSQPVSCSMETFQQQPAEGKEVEMNPISSTALSNIATIETTDESSLPYLNSTDMIRYAFESAVGFSESLDSNSCLPGVSNLETSSEMLGLTGEAGVNVEEEASQWIAGLMETQKMDKETHINDKDADSQVGNISMDIGLTDEQKEIEGVEKILVSEVSKQSTVKKSSTQKLQISEAENVMEPVRVLTFESHFRVQNGSSFVDKSRLEADGSETVDLLQNACNFSPSQEVRSENDDNATISTPAKCVSICPRVEGNTLVHQSPDQSKALTPNSKSQSTRNSLPIRRQWLTLPTRSSTASFRSKCKTQGQKSPVRFILPNPNPPSSALGGRGNILPFLKKSTKKQRSGPRCLQPIAPRIFGVGSSPLKTVVLSLKSRNKWQKEQQKHVEKFTNTWRILPKPDIVTTAQHPKDIVQNTSGRQQKKPLKNNRLDSIEKSGVESSCDGVGFVESEKEEQLLAGGSETDIQTEEENDEEQHLAELLEASTTIRGSQKGSRSQSEKGSKTEQKKEMALAMLSPDLLANDQLRDEREASFARVYHSKVRAALENDEELYRKFLQLLAQFDQKCKTVVELYGQMASLLTNYPDLISDFATFLSPEQAVECGCFLPYYRLTRARTFLCKLEVYFRKHPANFHKCLKAFREWHEGTFGNEELYNTLLPLIRSSSHLVEEFSMFFENKRPPPSRFSKYEEVTLGESDDENSEYSNYEQIDLPNVEKNYGTINCPCRCHISGTEQFAKKLRHCTSCGLKVVKGQLYHQTSDKSLRPVTVTYHHQNDGESETPDQSTSHKLSTKFKRSKETSLKRKKLTSKKSSNVVSAKDKRPPSASVEPDSTSMISPLPSEHGTDTVCPTAATDVREEQGGPVDIQTETNCTSESTGQPKIYAMAVSDDCCQNIASSSSSGVSPAASPVADCQLGCISDNAEQLGMAGIVWNTESAKVENMPNRDMALLNSVNGTVAEEAAVDSIPDEVILRNGKTSHDSLNEQINCGKDCSTLDIEHGFSQQQLVSAINSCSETVVEENNSLRLESISTVGQDIILPSSREEHSHSQPESAVTSYTAESRDGEPLSFSSKIDHSSSCCNKEMDCQSRSATEESSPTSQASVGWSKEEDRLILQTCQAHGIRRDTFQTIIETLTHRTVQQVSDRFKFLMSIFTQMSDNNLSDASATDEEDSDYEDDL